MTENPDADDVAAALGVSIGLLTRRLRLAQADGELSWPERSALARLDRDGPTTASALARFEQISPQSMGATLGALERRGLVERHSDPDDGRRVFVSVTEPGFRALRSVRTGRLVEALSTGFTHSELRQLTAIAPLIERLARSI
jgi:DNA-binding MarR family transcriptional regulator